MKEDKNKKNRKLAIAYGKDFPVSTKHAIAICSFIKWKSPQKARDLLEKTIMKKIAVPMKGEIPHRKNMPKGKPAGRYPVKASKYFIKLLKNLIANASVKGLNTELLIISTAIANKASKPVRATRLAHGRKKFKRTHILLEAIEGKEKEKKEIENKTNKMNKMSKKFEKLEKKLKIKK